MSIDSIKSIVRTIPSQAKGVADNVGQTSIKCAKTAGSYISEHLPKTIKNIKVPAGVDTFINSTKENVSQLKAGKFIKNNKETFVGSAVIIAAAACAISLIKGIIDKIKSPNTHEEAFLSKDGKYFKIKAHQG